MVDLEGRVLGIRSARGFSLVRITRFISEECRPVLIASDVRPAPKLLEKVAASFPVKLFTPADSLTAAGKRMLVRELGLRLRERHKTDALAAAIHAYRELRPLLDRIKRRLGERGMSRRMAGRVARMLVSRECNNIGNALRVLESQKMSKKRLR